MEWVSSGGAGEYTEKKEDEKQTDTSNNEKVAFN